MFIKCKIDSSCAKAMTISYQEGGGGGGGGGRIEVWAHFFFLRAQFLFSSFRAQFEKKRFEGSIVFHHCRGRTKKNKKSTCLESFIEDNIVIVFNNNKGSKWPLTKAFIHSFKVLMPMAHGLSASGAMPLRPGVWGARPPEARGF